jgi:hypothetical protein
LVADARRIAGLVLGGHGQGSFHILNQSYIEIASVDSVDFKGLADLHEFTITPNDTALIAIYHPIQMNLSELGGAENGWVYDAIIEEINIESGELVFQWNASDHVALNETYNTVDDTGTEETPFDYFHMYVLPYPIYPLVINVAFLSPSSFVDRHAAVEELR